MPLKLAIPGQPSLELHALVLDLNGTIAVDGEVLPGVRERLSQVDLDILLLTADTRGRASAIAESLGIPWQKLAGSGSEAEQKRAVVERLGADRVVALGNGRNDALMLAEAALGMAVMEAEGLAVKALLKADLVVRNPLEAFELLLHPQRLVATLRS